MRRMMPKPPLPAAPQPAQNLDEELCLMGVTRMDDFIEFVHERAVGGREMARGELADMWRDAAAAYKDLQTAEAGAADKPGILPMPPALQAHTARLSGLANFRSTFSEVPVAFGMVELDKLIVTQQHLTQSSIAPMLAAFKAPLSDAELGALCLPLTADASGFRVALANDEESMFIADNHDARFLGAQIIDPARIEGFSVNGHAKAVVALTVGYTTNVLNVVRYGQRIVLNNGYHRAFALRRLGVTHAPCLIQVCAHWEDVGLAGGGEMYENGPAYFSTARPPLLRDFTNPQLTRSFVTTRLRKGLRLSYDFRSDYLNL